jgi:hypothetical protein
MSPEPEQGVEQHIEYSHSNRVIAYSLVFVQIKITEKYRNRKRYTVMLEPVIPSEKYYGSDHKNIQFIKGKMYIASVVFSPQKLKRHKTRRDICKVYIQKNIHVEKTIKERKPYVTYDQYSIDYVDFIQNELPGFCCHIPFEHIFFSHYYHLLTRSEKIIRFVILIRSLSMLFSVTAYNYYNRIIRISQ